MRVLSPTETEMGATLHRLTDAMLDFTVGVRPGPSTVLTPRGELDLASVWRFEAACDSIDYSLVARVVLDLRDLAFIDATGLRAVLRLHALCLEQSVELLITPGTRGVQRVFELTGAHRLLPFDQSTLPHRIDPPRAPEKENE